MPFASAQAVLQCLLPLPGTQLQAECAHLVDDFMGPPWSIRKYVQIRFHPNVLVAANDFRMDSCSTIALTRRVSIALVRATICSVLLSRGKCGQPKTSCEVTKSHSSQAIVIAGVCAAIAE
jgi:hypothetical protein